MHVSTLSSDSQDVFIRICCRHHFHCLVVLGLFFFFHPSWRVLRCFIFNYLTLGSTCTKCVVGVSESSSLLLSGIMSQSWQMCFEISCNTTGLQEICLLEASSVINLKVLNEQMWGRKITREKQAKTTLVIKYHVAWPFS